MHLLLGSEPLRHPQRLGSAPRDRHARHSATRPAQEHGSCSTPQSTGRGCSAACSAGMGWFDARAPACGLVLMPCGRRRPRRRRSTCCTSSACRPAIKSAPVSSGMNGAMSSRALVLCGESVVEQACRCTVLAPAFCAWSGHPSYWLLEAVVCLPCRIPTRQR